MSVIKSYHTIIYGQDLLLMMCMCPFVTVTNEHTYQMPSCYCLLFQVLCWYSAGVDRTSGVASKKEMVN